MDSRKLSVRNPSHIHPLRSNKAKVISHKAHPDHPLTLLHSPPYESSTYRCNACGEYGSGFVYNCSICQYDMHVRCVFMPESVEREGHAHPLTLLYCSPYQNGLIFNCDICQDIVPDNLWSYYCKECDYGTHLHFCTVEEEEEEEPKRGGGGGGRGGSAASELATMLEAQREMEKMQMELHFEMLAKIAKNARINPVSHERSWIPEALKLVDCCLGILFLIFK